MKKATATIISLALIFIFASPAHPLIHFNNGINPKASAVGISYVVNINLAQEQDVCGNYLIMVTDGAGNLVAPPKAYVAGVISYNFKELGYGFTGTREARMVASPNLENVCDQQMVTEPEAMFTMYMPGTNYTFDLFPRIDPQHE